MATAWRCPPERFLMRLLREGISISRRLRTFSASTCIVSWSSTRMKPEEGLRLLASQEDVGVHVEVLRQGQVLVEGLDAQLQRVHGASHLHFLALEEDLAVVGVVDPRDHLDQRGLAGPVVPQQAHHLARVAPPGPRGPRP